MTQLWTHCLHWCQQKCQQSIRLHKTVSLKYFVYIFHVIWLLLVCFKTSTDYIKIKSKIAFNSNMVPNQKKVPQNCVKVHYWCLCWIAQSQCFCLNWVSPPAVADNVLYQTCWVITQQWPVWEGGLWLVIPQSLCDLFSWLWLSLPEGTHLERWRKGAISSEQPRGRHWQEEGLEQIDLWPSRVPLHCLLAERVWASTCICVHTHTKHTKLHIHVQTTQTPKILNLSYYCTQAQHQTLFDTLIRSCLGKCLSKGLQPLLAQAIHLRLSANADSRPIR